MQKLFESNGKKYKLKLTTDLWGSDLISIRENNKYIGLVDVLIDPTQSLLNVQANIMYNKSTNELNLQSI